MIALALAGACGEGRDGAGQDSAGTSGAGEASGGADDTADGGGEDGQGEELDDSVELLSPTDRLVRIAMALKGTRPSLEELAAVAQDPDVIESLVDEYLESPEFGETIRDLENQTLLMRLELPPNGELPADVDPIHWVEYTRMYYEEPLVLIADVVMNDQPYTEIVTSDTTMSTHLGPRFWAGIEDGFDPDGPEWQRLGYTDGRPAVGIISSGAFIKRYASSNRNAHREAAAAVAETLLCTSYSDRDIPLGSVDLTENDAVEEAILTNPTCVTCHQTLDPLGGFFDGFPRQTGFGLFPSVAWEPEEVGSNRNKTGRDNGYYGLGGETLDDLGELIANDHRFSACTARRYISYFSQVRRESIPIADIAATQRVLTESGMNIKEMVRAIVLADRFAVSHSTDEEVAEGVIGYLQTRPEQLQRMIEDLTGFSWRATAGNPNEGIVSIIDLPTNANFGFKVHGGSLDNETKVLPVHQYSAHASVFLRGLAAEAAGAVTARDFAQAADQRALLRYVEADTTDEAAIREQLAFLHLRILAEDVEPDSETIDETYALFTALHSTTDDVPTTWKLVLGALFQDFRVAYH
ncbi:MAG: hypothetical protein AAF799_32990 [Myxococcota bacterium]